MPHDAQSIIEKMKPFSLSDQAIVNYFLQKYLQENAQLTFAGFFLWGKPRKHLFCEIDNHLIVSFENSSHERILYPPLGPKPEKLITEVFSPYKGFRWGYIDELLAKKLENKYTIRHEEGHSDYIYDIKKLTELKGGDFEVKRNYIRRCIKYYQPEVVDITIRIREECIDLCNQWMKKEARPQKSAVDAEITAMDLALTNFEELGLHGIGVRVANKLVAFAIAAPLSETMLVEHFEKALNEYTGLYQFTLHEFVKRIPSHYRLLNREADLEIPGLKEAKEGWHPKYLLHKYSVYQ